MKFGEYPEDNNLKGEICIYMTLEGWAKWKYGLKNVKAKRKNKGKMEVVKGIDSKTGDRVTLVRTTFRKDGSMGVIIETRVPPKLRADVLEASLSCCG